MSKKASALVLTGLMVINQISDTTVIYASESIQPANNQQQSDTQTKQVVYLMNGEGDLKGGDGTKERPYQNIRTALEQVADGGVIKLIGTVQYNKHDIDTDTNSALPLMITKNVTFEGASNNSKNDGIVSRAPIQLGANVTFKDIRI